MIGVSKPAQSNVGVGTRTHLEAENTIEVADGAGDRLPHVQKRVLQEVLYRHTIAHAELRRERVAGPEARPAEEVAGPASATI